MKTIQHIFPVALTLTIAFAPLSCIASPNDEAAAEVFTIDSLAKDPGALCPLKDKRIPANLNDLKKMAPLKSTKRLSCADYLGDFYEGCIAEHLKFDGLEIIAIVQKSDAWVADIEITSSKFDYLGSALKIGASVKELERAYGKKIPISKSPVVLQGECIPLIIWQTDGRITKVKLPCHAC